MASKDTTLKIIVEAQNKTAAGLSGVSKSLEGMKESALRVSDTLKNMGKVGAVAFTALSAASAKLIKDSAESLQIEESYRRMTKQAGIAADELVAQLQKTSAGTVSTTDLMLSANRAMALGVGENMETVTQLMEVARLKGRALGLTTTQAFNDIVTGIGRGSPLILDNLGITIKLGEAQEMYAAKLGKTAQELTDAEKKQALLNAVLESGNAEVAAAGELSFTTAEKMQAMKAQMADTADTLGRALIPAATRLLEAITPVIEKVASWIEANPKLTASIAGIAIGGAALLVVLGAVGVAIPIIISAFALFTGTAGVVIATLGALTLAITQVVRIVDLLRNQWDDVWLGIKLTVAETVNSVVSMIEAMINKVIDGINFLIKKVNGVISKVARVSGINFGSIGTLDQLSLNRVDTNALISRDMAERNGSQVVVTGNTFLSEDAAEQMGDLIISKLRLSNSLQ